MRSQILKDLLIVNISTLHYKNAVNVFIIYIAAYGSVYCFLYHHFFPFYVAQIFHGAFLKSLCFEFYHRMGAMAIPLKQRDTPSWFTPSLTVRCKHICRNARVWTHTRLSHQYSTVIAGCSDTAVLSSLSSALLCGFGRGYRELHAYLWQTTPSETVCLLSSPHSVCLSFCLSVVHLSVSFFPALIIHTHLFRISYLTLGNHLHKVHKKKPWI